MSLINTVKKFVIIDTDCGVDDAAAILLALSDKERTEVLAITCCAGNTTVDNVCNNVMRILVLSKEKEIPVYRGSEGPLVFPYSVSTYFGSDGLCDISGEFPLEDMEIQNIPAAIALINLVKKYPKRITLAALGPLTNIALAHRIDSKFTSNLKGLVLLGGNYQGVGNISPAAEFNFHFDPEAAHVVMTESSCPVTMVPWETVLDVQSNESEHLKEYLREFVQHKTEKARFWERVWSGMRDSAQEDTYSKFHDFDMLAVAAVIHPESVLASVHFPVTVECSGRHTRGQVVVERDSDRGKTVNIITKFSDVIINKLRLKMTEN